MLVRLATTLVILGAIAAQAAAAETTATARDDFFAINGTKIFHLRDASHPVARQRFALMRELGIRWDRIDLWWDHVEPAPGQWTWTLPDSVFDEFERNGVQWYPILCYGAQDWEARRGPRTDEDFARWEQYVERTLSRYRGRAPYWSVWNEPNIPDFWRPEPRPEDYARMLRVTREAARRADPAAKLCAPSIAPLSGWDRKFVERLYELGAKDNFDVFDYHYYRTDPPEDALERELAEIRAVMARHGDAKPVWVSESGITSPIQHRPESYERQASLVARNLLLARALGVERFFYFDMQNWHDDPHESWDSTLGLVEAGGARKPSFFAVRTLVRETSATAMVGRVRPMAGGAEAVLMRDPADGSYTLSAWLTEKQTSGTTVEVAAAGDSLRVVDWSGAETTVDAGDGRGAVPLSIHPCHIHGVAGAAYLSEAGVTMDPHMVIIAAGESHPLRIGTSPLLERPAVRVLDVETSAGIVWDHATGTLSCTQEAHPGIAHLHAAIEVEHGPADSRRTDRVERRVRVEVIRDVVVTLRPLAAKDGAGLSAHVSVGNRGKRNVAGELALLASDTSGTEKALGTRAIELQPLGRATHALPVPESALPTLTTPASRWVARLGASDCRPFRAVAVPVGGSAPVVDGDLSDWPDTPPIVIDGADQISRNFGEWSPDDASARVRLALVGGVLYVAADVSDDDPMHNPHPAKAMYKGDALELYLGVAGPTNRSVLDKAVEFQIGLAPVTEDGRPAVFQFHKDEPVADARIAARRTGRGYALEAAIPLASLGVDVDKLAPGHLIGLDIALDDLDADDWAPAGNDKGRALIWNGTGMNWIDPSNWGMGVLRDAEARDSR